MEVLQMFRRKAEKRMVELFPNLTIRTWLACSFRLRISASIHRRTEIAAAFEKSCFFLSDVL